MGYLLVDVDGGRGWDADIAMEGIVTRAQVMEMIAVKQAKIADLRATGTQRMSKTGVKWCISVNRDEIKRLRKWAKELEAAK